MTKCKKKNCNNKAVEDKKYCRHHQAKKEGRIKTLLGTTLPLVALAIVRKVKD